MTFRTAVGVAGVLVLTVGTGGCAKYSPHDPATLATERAAAEDWTGAIEQWNKVLEEDPQSSRAYHGRAYAKKRLGDLQGAIDDYSAAIRIAPSNGIHFAGRGEARIQRGDTVSACGDFQRAVELGYTKAQTEVDQFCK